MGCPRPSQVVPGLGQLSLAGCPGPWLVVLDLVNCPGIQWLSLFFFFFFFFVDTICGEDFFNSSHGP